MSRRRRIALGGLVAEGGSFTPVPTRYDDFVIRDGDEVAALFGVGSAVAGFARGCDRHGFDAVPAWYADAEPGAAVSQPDFERLLDGLVQSLRRRLPVDGVLLELHGALLVESLDVPDAHILRAARRVVGDEVPIVCEIDIHANLSREMHQPHVLLSARRRYPEDDMVEVGEHCADLLAACLRGSTPTMVTAKLPLLWGLNQVTEKEPMRSFAEEVARVRSIPGIADAFVNYGMEFADVPWVGASVTVTAHDVPLAREHALALSRLAWDRRDEWAGSAPRTAEILARLDELPRPVVLADFQDNPGGSAPGDSTGALRALLQRSQLRSCLLYLNDMPAARRAHEAGAGARIAVDLGGRSHPDQGTPVRVDAEVLALSDGRFVLEGPMAHGVVTDLGPTAALRAGPVDVVVTTSRTQPLDWSLPRRLGLAHDAYDVIVVKSQGHFRAGFGALAGCILEVAEPSVNFPPGGLRYRNVGRRLYPADLDATWDADHSVFALSNDQTNSRLDA